MSAAVAHLWLIVGFPGLVEDFCMLRNLLRNRLDVVQFFDEVVAVDQLLIEIAASRPIATAKTQSKIEIRIL